MIRSTFCLLRERIHKLIRKVEKVDIDPDKDKNTRIDIFSITAGHIHNLLSKNVFSGLMHSIIEASSTISGKFNRALKDWNSSEKATRDDIVKKLSTGTDVSAAEALRANSIGLQEILAAVKGEIDKARTADIETSAVSNNSITPNIPMNRLAAVIGRKVLYPNGVRYKKFDANEEPASAAEVESHYWLIGLRVLEDLKKAKLINIFYPDNGEAASTLRDYRLNLDKNTQDDSISSGKSLANGAQIYTEAAAVSLSLAAIGLDPKNSADLDPIGALTDPLVSVDGTYFGALKAALSVVSLTSSPATVVLPGINEAADRKNFDNFTLSKEFEEARTRLSKSPSYIHQDMHDLFRALFKKVGKSGKKATEVLRMAGGSAEILEQLFDIELDNVVDADHASAVGRRLSKTVAIDDLIEHYSLFDSDQSPDLYMALFAGDNTRLYYDNSILNIHQSKLMRYAMTTGEHEIDVAKQPERALSMALSLALQLDINIGDKKAPLPDVSAVYGVGDSVNNKNLDSLISLLDKFSSSRELSGKLNAVSAMKVLYPDMPVSQVIASARAVKEFREGIKSGTIKTSYASTADATASGGQLILMQALGSDSDGSVANLLRRLGVLKGEFDGEAIEDIYRLLTDDIKAMLAADGISGPALSGKDKKAAGFLEPIKDLLFSKKVRDLSKPVTMTFLYDQSENGAVKSLSIDITSRIVKLLRAEDVSAETILLINQFLETNYTQKDVQALRSDKELVDNLRKAVAKSGAPALLYNRLRAVLETEYLVTHKARDAKIFELLDGYKELRKLRAMPATWRVENPNSTFNAGELAKFGVTLGKMVEVQSEPIQGVSVLTRPRKLRKGVMTVSTIHSADTADLYLSINRVLKRHPETEYKGTLLVVHDEVIGPDWLVQEVVAEYNQVNFEVAMYYDIHNEILTAAAVEHPEIIHDPDYIAIANEVKDSILVKQRILTDESNGYDNKTTSVIGRRIGIEGVVAPNTSGKEIFSGNETNQVKGRTSQTKTPKNPSGPQGKVEKPQTLEVENEQAQKLKEEFAALHKSNPDAILTYDVETSDAKSENPFVVEIGYSVGNNSAKSVKIKLTQEEAKDYLKGLRGTKDIVESDIYKAIKASHKQQNGMKSWNKNAVDRDTAISDLEALAAKAEAIVGFNSTIYDDKFFNFSTTHDVRALAGNIVNVNESKTGKLTDLANVKNSHSADSDVEATYALMVEIANKPKSSKTSSSTVTDNAIETLKGFAGESELVAKFLENIDAQSSITAGDKFKFDHANDVITYSDTDPDTGNKLDLTNDKDRKKFLSLLEHEILHSYSLGVFNDKAQAKTLEVKYLKKVLAHIRKNVNSKKVSLSDEARSRVDHILNSSTNEAVQLAELLSVLSGEPEVAEELYSSKLFKDNGNRLKDVVLALVKRVRGYMLGLTSDDLKKSSGIDPALTMSAINHVVATGQSARQANATTFRKVQEIIAHPELDFNVGKEAGILLGRGVIDETLDLANASVARYLNDPAVRGGRRLTKWVHDQIKRRFSVYEAATDKIYNYYQGSEALKSLAHKITNSGVNNEIKNAVLSMFAKARSDKLELISTELQKFNLITSKMSKDEMAAYYDFTMKMPLQNYFKYAEDVSDIEAEIAAIELDMRTNSNLGKVISQIDSIVDMNVHGIVGPHTVYNVDMLPISGNENVNQAKKLLVLKSIKDLGIDRFNDFLKNRELLTLVKSNLLANDLVINDLNGKGILRDNLIKNEYKEDPKPVLVTVENYDRMQDLGFKTALKPTENAIGIMYSAGVDSTYQEGTFTEIRTQNTDLRVEEKYKDMPNVVKVGDEYRYVMDDETRKAMGEISDPSQSIVRTTAHSLAIKDTEMIRDKLLEASTYWDMADRKSEDLVAMINSKTEDHPWFLGAEEGKVLEDYPAEVKQAYKRVPIKLSDSKGFDEKIQYVRKDIAYWLIGSNEPSIASRREFQWAVRVVKNVVSASKIGMVVLNPAKIAGDNFSNVSYLAAMGVSPLYVAKHYSLIAREYDDYHKKKNEMMRIKLESYSDPAKYGALYEKLKKELKEMPTNGVVERGFISSLGSDLVMQTNDPSSGLNSDMEAVLQKIMSTPEGKNSAFGKFIMKAANWDIGLDRWLEAFTDLFDSFNITAPLSTELKSFNKRVENIKSEDDAVTYAMQYLNSPNSQAVKLGTHMTDLTDILSKETYYRYLVNEKGMNEKKAELEVVDAFPDYKEGMPTKVKQLSDIGILMFPSFWLRIQKTIYRMAKDRPVSFGTEMAIEHWANIDAETIWDQNILQKASSSYGLIHNPWNLVGWGTLFPTNIF